MISANYLNIYFLVTVTTCDIPDLVHDRHHCDVISGLPMPHLSYIIRYIIRPYYMSAGRDFVKFSSAFPGATTHIIGGPADDLVQYLCNYKNYSNPSEFLQELYSPLVVCVKNYIKVGDCGSILDIGDLILDTRGCHKGYARLTPNNLSVWDADVKFCENNNVWIQHMDVKITKSNFDCDNCIFSGFSYSGLPQEAMEWVTRNRKTDWPNPSTIGSVVEKGCILISRAHAHSPLPNVEWQFIFDEAEKALEITMTKNQKYCFRVFSELLRYYANSLSRRLEIAHLKSVMYYACETIPKQYWAENCGGCLLYLLDKLILHVSVKCLPCYFICENNLIDYFSDEELLNIKQRLLNIRRFPIPSVVFMAESHGIKQTFMIVPAIEDIPVFKNHRNIAATVESAFVPGVILLAKAYVDSEDNDMVGNLFKMAFIERSSLTKTKSVDHTKVESSDEFKEFVVEILNRENYTDRISLAKILDKLFHMDLRSSVKIEENIAMLKDIIGKEDAGKYADHEIPKHVLHCTMAQMDFLDTFAYDLYMKGKFQEAEHFLKCGIAKSEKAKAELIDTNDIFDVDLKEEILRQNAEKERKVQQLLEGMLGHVIMCRNPIAVTEYIVG